LQTVRLLRRVWIAIVSMTLIVGAGICVQTALRAISAQHDAVAVMAPAGAPVATAALGMPLETAAPAAGVTGTIDLPDLPIPAGLPVATETGVVAARPFSMASASAIDRGRAAQCLTAAVYYEAASESDAGQLAVAQVILNRVRHPAFPGTVCGVVYQGSEHAGCQFSFACDGAAARVPARGAWIRAGRAAGMALAGYVFAPVGLATHYHSYAVTPDWNRSMVMTDVVGAHFFHRWKGYWGTAAALSQTYRGGEPLPGAHVPVEPVARMVAALPVIGEAAAPSPVAPVDMLPGESQVLERWKDSGKPLE
jgi:spore germination cell wall hydrolase CwlJ-like protein